jgi:hypothetical protein
MTYQEAQDKRLLTTQEQIDAINALLPAATQVAGWHESGQLVIGADLLTDCGEDCTYAAACALLESLPVIDASTPDLPVEL